MFRSSQSTHRESASPPTTTAFLKAPVCRKCEAVTVANRNPEQAAVRSNATALVAPTALAMAGASPKRSSGVLCAQTGRE